MSIQRRARDAPVPSAELSAAASPGTGALRPGVTLASSAGMGLATLALLPLLPDSAPEGPFVLTIWMVAALTAATELAALHRHGEEHTHTLSLSEITLVIGLAFAAPGDLVLGRVLAGLAVYLLYRRLPLLKVGFNTMLFALETAAAAAVYRWVLGGSSPALPGGWLAALVGVAAATAIGFGALRVIMALHGGRETRKETTRIIFLSLILTAVATAVGLLAVAALWTHTAAFALVGVVAAFTYGGFRMLIDHLAIEELRSRLETAVTRCREEPETIRSALELVRAVIRAETVEMILPAGDRAVRMKLDAGVGMDTAGVQPGRLGPILGDLARGRRIPAALDDGTHEALRLELASRGLDGPMVVPLHHDGRVVGYLAAGGKQGPERSFGRADLQVLAETARCIELARLDPSRF